MSEPTRTELQKAYQLIKSGEKEEAISVLRPMLTVDPNNADGWWLLANAVSEPAEQRSALEKVVMLRPDHAQAREKLAELKGETEFSFDNSSSAIGFGDTPEKAKRKQAQPIYVQPAKKGTNPVLVILAIIGAIALLICGACFVLSIQVFNSAGPMVATVMNSMPGSLPKELSSVSNVQSSAIINKTDSVSGQLNSTSGAQEYTFSGETGQDITITVLTRDKDFVPEVGLYDPSGTLVESDFSAGSSKGATITRKLPSSGTYTIVVRGFFSHGKFTLTLQ
jgi:hypothetical protein